MVRNTQDSGADSLRDAITLANANPGPDQIMFDIPASTSPNLNVPVPGFNPVTQDWTITLLTPLPALTDTVWIDGYTQAESGIPFRYPSAISSAGQTVAITGTPTGGTFTLSTQAPLPVGTVVLPYNATAATIQAALGPIIGIQNLIVTGGPGPDSAFTITFQGSYSGIDLPDLIADPTGLTGGTSPGVLVQTTSMGGVATGVPIFIASSPNTVQARDGNNAHIRLIVDGSGLSGATGFVMAASHSILRGLVISGFDVGVQVPAVDSSGSTIVGTLIQGNAIGNHFFYPVDSRTGSPLTGAAAVGYTFGGGNAQQAVIVAASNTTIGGVNPQESNVICGNGAQGVFVQPGASGNQILGNQIGMAGPSVNGLYAQDGNGAEGILFASTGVAADPLGIVFTSSGQISGNVVSGNRSAGIRLTGVGTIRNLIQGNLVGVAPGGGYRFGSGDPGNESDGILLEDAGQNLIGGGGSTQGNAIGANWGAGIRITGASATGNVITNNMVGLTADGTQVLGNAGDGVAIYSADNVVGPGNVISQNLRGIGVYGPTASRILVVDNLIGTDGKGTKFGFGNAFEGVRIDGSAANTIQGNASGSQVISGNKVGIAILGAGATGNLVTGNLIGSDITGLSDLGNKDIGVLITSSGNTVGGNAPGLRNLISANHTGIQFDGASATGNLVAGNSIGTDLTGIAPLSNEVLGVFMTGGASNNSVGGVTIEQGNRIAFHDQDGIRIVAGTGNSILSNSIWANRRLGIDLVDPTDPPSGVTPNPASGDPPVRTGPNNLQTYPVLASVTTNGTITHILGTLYSQPSTQFLIQFFASPTASASGFGQGQKRLGSVQVTTDASGNAQIDALLGSVYPSGTFLSATATNLSTGDTSEFARQIVLSPALQFSVDAYQVNESAGTAVVTVTRTLNTGTSTVNYATAAGGTATALIDYTPASGTLTFNPGESLKTFTVQILDDGQLETKIETVNLALTTGTGGHADFRTSAVLKIVDDDATSSRIYYVTNTADSGPGSLRQAIIDANNNPGHDDIEFAIPASADSNLNVPVPGFDPITQTWTITPQSALPTIIDPVTIDGYTQAHFPVPYRYPNAVTAVQVVNVSGNPTAGSFTLRTQSPLALMTTGDLPFDATASHVGLELIALFGMGNVTVTGGPANVAPLTISFRGDYQGLSPPLLVPTNHLSGGTDPEITVTGSVVLQDPVSIASSPNQLAARDGNDATARVIIDGSLTPAGTTGFVLDTSNSMLRGLIIDGFGTGISVPSVQNVGNLIQGNAIGTYFLYPVNPTTGAALQPPYNVLIAGLGNTGEGLLIRGTNTIIGGTDPQESNVIGNSGRQGILIDTGSHGNVIQGNQIGMIGPSLNGRYARVPNQLEGILIQGSSNAVGGPGSGSGNLISANQGSGVRIVGLDATRNVIGANVIGLGPGGGYLFGTGNPGNGGDGVTIENSASNQVGGPDSSWANVISSNAQAGVVLSGAGATGNVVLNNLIGLTADGKTTKGNSGDGVTVMAPGAIIGPSNVISGNLRGVHVVGAVASEATVKDNLIGTDSSGAFDRGNALEGVLIEDSTDAKITGDGHGSQVISGNQRGVVVAGNTSTRNLIQGNLIGTDLEGSSPIPNAHEGVVIQDAPGNTINAGNVISGNHWGIRLDGPGTTGTVIQGNLIGTDVSGVLPLGNEVNGVIVSGGASANLIGGSSQAAGNSIAFNVLAGVLLESGIGNSILSNSIWLNGRLGIDLVDPNDPPSGVTPNQPGIRVGPNNLQNAPVLTTAVGGSTDGSVQGTLNSVPNTTFTIQFFQNTVPDPSGHGQGRTLIGSTEVTTDGAGDAAFSFTPPDSLAANAWISATATNQFAADTSEFSNDVSAQPVSVEFVTSITTVDATSGSTLIHVQRIGNLNAIVSVDYATSDGTAKAGLDYLPASGTLTFQVGQIDKTFQVVILPNPARTTNASTVNLALSQPTGGATLGPMATSVLSINNNLPPTMQFKSATFTAYSTSSSVTVTVIRGGGSLSTPVQVQYATAGGSAVPGVDYSPTTGTVSFLPNQTTATFTVPLIPGSHPAGTVEVGLVLSNPSSGAALGALSQSTLKIITPSGPNPYGPIDSTRPQVLGQRLLLGPQGVSAIVLTFSKAMDPARAQDLANYGYFVIIAGADGKLGTSDDGSIPLAAVSYDPASWSVAVVPSQPIPWNQFARLTLDALANPLLGRGLTDTSGNLLAGQGGGLAYTTDFGVGTQLFYADPAGKTVKLSLSGGGVIQIFRNPAGDPRSVTLIGTVPRKSVLSLHADNRGARFTYLPPIQGASGVRLRYRTPPFVFRGGAASHAARMKPAGVHRTR